jgi:hypothetical protein
LIRWNGDILRVPPEPLQVIVRPGIRQKDVDDKVAVILKDPFPVVITFDADGKFAAIFQLVVNLVADGLILAGVRSGANQEKIGETGDLAQVERDQILRLLGLGSTCGCDPIRFNRLCRFFGLSVTSELLG